MTARMKFPVPDWTRWIAPYDEELCTRLTYEETRCSTLPGVGMKPIGRRNSVRYPNKFVSQRTRCVRRRWSWEDKAVHERAVLRERHDGTIMRPITSFMPRIIQDWQNTRLVFLANVGFLVLNAKQPDFTHFRHCFGLFLSQLLRRHFSIMKSPTRIAM